MEIRPLHVRVNVRILRKATELLGIQSISRLHLWLAVSWMQLLFGHFKISKGHFAHEPRAVTRFVCGSSKESVQNHVVVRSRTLKCSVKSYVTGPSTKCYFNEFSFMRTGPHRL
jgi:hypothetical protein